MRKIPNLITDRKAKLPGDYVPQSAMIDLVSRLLAGNTLTIYVPGAPIGKPRMTRRDKWAKRPAVVRYREWADRVRAIAGKVPPAETVQSLSWTATFACPKSWSKKRRLSSVGWPHRSKPDRDNIDKAVLDALYPDGDEAIARGSLEKRWGIAAGMLITIVTGNDAETIVARDAAGS